MLIIKSVFHVVASTHYGLFVWYDVNYVEVSIVHFERDMEFMKGRLKFLTMWNLKKMNGGRALCHLMAAVHFWYGCYYDWHYVHVPASVHKIGAEFGKSGKLRFLTYWDTILQALFFSICFVNDLIGSDEVEPRQPPLVRRLRDTILACLAFPLSMFVGLTFWGLYMVDRELIFPRILDDYFPSWLNHIMHTNIMIFIVIEMYTSFRQYPKRKFGLKVLLVFMAIYLVWVHIIYVYSGNWVYPILEVLNLPMRIVFYIVLLVLVVALYVFGEKLNEIMWREQIRKQRKIN